MENGEPRSSDGVWEYETEQDPAEHFIQHEQWDLEHADEYINGHSNDNPHRVDFVNYFTAVENKYQAEVTITVDIPGFKRKRED
jgi:hypothetical protein